MRKTLGPAVKLSLIWLVALASQSSRGEDQKPEPADEPPVIPLTISPAAEPVPALKYRLLPPIGEQTQGNAAIDYQIALLGPDVPPIDEKKFDSWRDLPADGLPRHDVEQALEPYAALFAGLDQAARRETCDWQLPIVRDAFNTRLDQFQAIRMAAKVLAVKARLQIAADDLAGALSSMRTIFKMSRDCNEARLAIPTIIACAAASTNTDTLQAFVQHPKAPNLYWALTDLPSPLIECGPAFEVETLMMEYQFPQLGVFRSRRLSADEARRLSDEILKRWVRDVRFGGFSIGKTFQEAQDRFATAARSANDKRVLLDSGWSRQDVASMAPEQVAWLILDYRWHAYRDEFRKWARVPASQRRIGLHQAEQRLKDFLSSEGNPLAGFELVRLLAAEQVVYDSADRRDRPIALFRVIEALRMHAAAHGGKLPPSLEALDTVPIPVDPMSGKPFLYQINADGTADLQTPAIHPNNRFYGKHYVIRLRK